MEAPLLVHSSLTWASVLALAAVLLALGLVIIQPGLSRRPCTWRRRWHSGLTWASRARTCSLLLALGLVIIQPEAWSQALHMEAPLLVHSELGRPVLALAAVLLALGLVIIQRKPESQVLHMEAPLWCTRS